MSENQKPLEDELAGTEQPFVTHLMELRDRLVRALIAVGVAAVILGLYPGPAALYDILASPLVANLPTGATLIATSVISPFMVPLKILVMTAFLLALSCLILLAVQRDAPPLRGDGTPTPKRCGGPSGSDVASVRASQARTKPVGAPYGPASPRARAALQ